jgi:putative transposase
MIETDDFQQLKLRFLDPIQHDYEVIRPVVLFAKPVAERSRETDLERTTVGEKARRFVQHGMLGLVDKRPSQAGRKGHQYPDPVARHILYLKQLYPPIHYHEIIRIVERKFGYQTNHHTIQHFLEANPIPEQLELKLTTFHEFEDAYEARWEVVKMFYEGWQQISIAGLLKLSERHVRRILEAFEKDSFVRLEDKRMRPTDHPDNQLTLPFLEEVLEIQQEYPKAGRFRVQGLLAQRRAKRSGEDAVPSESTVGRAMRINRLFFKAPGPWPPPEAAKEEIDPAVLPYEPLFRHEFWFIDVRYLVKLEGRWIYSICIVEGYSRKILAGMVSEYQDELAVLQLLHAALAEYGCPLGIVSDNGAVFYGNAYLAVLNGLKIEPCYIEKGQAWQNLIEAQFKIQLRLADAKFEQAQNLEEIQVHHAEFIQTFNTTQHWAHRERGDGLRTPEAVLDWERGRLVEPETLRRLFRTLQFERTVNRHGFVSIQRFYIYAEHGLAKKRVAVWIYEGWARVEYQQTLLAHYNYTYDHRRKALRTISHPKLYRTPFASPQLEFFELDDREWHKVMQRPVPIPRRKRVLPTAEQLFLSFTELQTHLAVVEIR